MNILAIDDMPVPLRALESAIRQAQPDANVFVCQSASQALSLIENNPCEVAFVDIHMPEINGIELAKRMKLKNPNMNIIFATGYDEYMDSAFAMHASGYLMKPITADAVREELQNLRHPPVPFVQHRVTVQCFGNFEVYIDGKPLRFQYEKTKEVFAYLINCRSMCSNREIIAVLWEHDISDSYFRTLRKDLADTFRRAGAGNVILLQRGKLGVDSRFIVCDYYQWIIGTPTGLNAYHGEYMRQYSWAEFYHPAMSAPKSGD